MPTKKAEPVTPKAAPASKAAPKTAKPRAKAVTPKPTKPKAKPKTKKPIGRPTMYSSELAAAICAELACGLSMRTVCKSDEMPAMSTVFKWLTLHKEFAEQYTRAKAESADALVEEMMDIADDGTNDWMEVHDKEGECVGYKVNGEHVQRSRLRVETRKWVVAKLKPKVYGDKVAVDHGVDESNPLAQMMAQLAGRTLKPVAENE